MSKQDLKSMSPHELKRIFVDLGEKPFRAEQTFRWIHQKMINSIEDITVLSKELRDKLKDKYKISNLEILKRFDSKLDSTKKYLFLLEDNNIIESVLMEYKHGFSVCLSTQVGCRMGCTFCASTKGGLLRNLKAGEILDQVYKIQKDLDIKINNIVLMGTGEPLDNFNNVIRFLEIIHEKKGQNIGYRHITLSTSGIVPKIYELADMQIPITLSISLHSPFQEEREKIMPIGKKYNIEEIIKACKYYVMQTNRRITFEYTLINGVNDREKDADELSRLLKGLLSHINLIPLNPIKETKLNRSKKTNITRFQNILTSKGISTTIRREMGGDINAACGQLRWDYMKNKNSLV